MQYVECMHVSLESHLYNSQLILTQSLICDLFRYAYRLECIIVYILTCTRI